MRCSQRRSLCAQLVQRAVQPFVVNGFHRDAAQVLQRRARVPFLGHAQLRGLSAELAHREHRRHIGPGDLLAPRLDQFIQQLVQAQPSPQRECKEHRAKLAHALDAQAPQVTQFPALLGFAPAVRGGKKLRLEGRRRTAVQQSLDVLPACVEILVGQFAQTGHHLLAWAPLGAHGLAEGRVLVDLPVERLAILAEEHARIIPGFRIAGKGLFSTTRPFAGGTREIRRKLEDSGAKIPGFCL